MSFKTTWRTGVLALLLGAAAHADKLVYPLPPDSEVGLQKDLKYSGDLRFDLYRPARQESALPVVLFMNGIGMGMRGFEQYTGWSKLVAGSGLAAVTYDSREGKAVEDAQALLRH